MAPKVGNKRLLRDVVAQTCVLDVLHHADDFHVGPRSGVGPEAQMAADRILPAKVAPRELLVDHHLRRRPVVRLGTVFDLAVVLQREVAAGDDGYAKGNEVIRADLVHVRLRMVIGPCRIVAFHGHPAVPLVVFEDSHGRESNAAHAWNGVDAVGQL